MDSPITPTLKTEPQASLATPGNSGSPLSSNDITNIELQVLAIMRWLARGYTIRFIQQAAIRQHWTFTPTPELIVKIREDQDAAIIELRQLEADETMRSGPSQRPERIRRLSQIAEDLETRIESSEAPSPRLVAELRSTLRDIRDETAPRPGYSPNQDDTWLVLLQRLAPSSAGSEPQLNQPNDSTQEISESPSATPQKLGGVQAGVKGVEKSTSLETTK